MSGERAIPHLKPGPHLKLGTTTVGDGMPPYVIAEIGVNHEGSLDKAKELIDDAHRGGAHAAKFQTYKAETLASRHSPAYWDTRQEPTESQYALFKKHDGFGEADYEALAEHCSTVGIDFLSTPFDDRAVDFLDPLMPFFKVASADLTNTPFLRRIGAKKKAVVLSTGASTIAEITTAVGQLEDAGAAGVALLHCVLNYPTPTGNTHLNMIDGLREVFPDHVIGYSDHTVPDAAMAILTAAYVKGAHVIEKHFTFDKSLPGNDHYHAMDADDLARFSANVALLEEAAGRHDKAPLESEEISRANARRSVVMARPVAAGTILGEDDLTYKRPGTGISPLHWDTVIGSRARAGLDEDHVLQWDDLDKAGE